MNRMRIRILNQNDVVQLVNALNTWTDKFILESEDGMYRVNAKSVLGVFYFTTEHPLDTYLVNLTSGGYYPDGAKCFQF